MTKHEPSPDRNPEIDHDTDERDDAVIGSALRWSLLAFAVLGTLAGVAALVLTRPAPPPPIKKTDLAEVQVREASQVYLPRVRFTDVTKSAGIEFRHENGARGRKLLPETMGGGCAFLDFEGDGDQDLLFVNSQRWPWDGPPAEAAPQPTMALYRNDGQGTFEDVTPGSGLDISLYGMGVAVGDYDNDGRDDVYLSAVGENRLFHNEGGGKFRDVTREAGVGGDANQWSTSCGWLDHDGDGDLDLFVCNYVKWSREYDEAQNFQLTGGGRAYGRPQNFEGTFPYLFRNEGGGRFTEVAQAAGLHVRNEATGVPMAKSLGATFADFDNDARIDIVVANDTVQNFLFHNEGGGKFRELGAVTGVAFDQNGNARGAMGIDAARFRNNDAIGVAIGNFANEMTALYVSYGDEMKFMDEAISTGLGPNTRLELTFGVFYFDYDLDGRLDLFAANGHLEEDINRVQPSQHYAQPPHLFWNCGHAEATEFLPVPVENCGSDLMKPTVGRGAAFADIDNDGDLDVLITAAGQAPRLLRNDQDQKHHWLRFKLVGAKCNRNAIGAWIEVELEDRVLRRQVMPTRSYVSQVELPVTIGLGDADQVRRVSILWPDGSRQMLEDILVDQMYEITQTTESAEPVSRVGPRIEPWPPRSLTSAASAPPSLLALVISTHNSSCGSHLAEDRSLSLPTGTASDANPRPSCQGPNCSRAPPNQSVPPSDSPPPHPEREHALVCAIGSFSPPRLRFLVGPDIRSETRDLATDIFRPPRAC